FDGVDTTLAALAVTSRLVRGIRFDAARMRAAALEGYTLATEAADYLTRRGLPFREAHRLVGRAVAFAIKEGRPLGRLTMKEWQTFSPLFEADLFESLTLEAALNARAVVGGTAPARVKEALARG
ncbi:MAG TPA: argininosuccinate lyase, partial [Candidatus Dormibacteraeota bacterium]|nr:argininosuccinate lyase [Candidatus Dormibacteraeota bacterium]